MKRIIFFLVLFMSSLTFGQTPISKTDNLIPQLQYDQDFMTYLEINMKDGFITIKQIIGKMKFVAGQKIYAIEKKRFDDQNRLIQKTTYFYLKDKPIAITIQDKTKVKVFYLSDDKIIGYKEFKLGIYKHFGGKQTLNLKNISPQDSIPQLDAKILSQAPKLLNIIKQSSKDIFNYSF